MKPHNPLIKPPRPSGLMGTSGVQSMRLYRRTGSSLEFIRNATNRDVAMRDAAENLWVYEEDGVFWYRGQWSFMPPEPLVKPDRPAPTFETTERPRGVFTKYDRMSFVTYEPSKGSYAIRIKGVIHTRRPTLTEAVRVRNEAMIQAAATNPRIAKILEAVTGHPAPNPKGTQP